MSTLNVTTVNVTDVNTTNATVSGNLTVGTKLQLPSYTTANRPASPATGTMVFDTTEEKVIIWDGDSWEIVGAAAAEAAIFEVQLWGAGGGGGRAGGWDYGADGGGGGYTYGKLFNLTSGSNLILQVGQGGPSSSGASAFGGGGPNCQGGGDCRYGARGGGYTGLFLTSVSHANAILIAGGGGGGGSSRAQEGNVGGAGGGECGQDGKSPYDSKTTYRGRGGSGAAAGDMADSDNQNAAYQAAGALLGGSPRINSYGGSGGGGYYGGSAGNYSEQHTMAGGGGGSGYINYTYVQDGYTATGEYRSPAGGGAKNYSGGGQSFGGQAAADGGDGFAAIKNLATGVTTTYAYTGSNETIVVP